MTENKPASVKLTRREPPDTEAAESAKTFDDVDDIWRALYDAAPDEATEALREGLTVLRCLVNDAELTGLDKNAGWDAWFGQARYVLDRLRQTPEGRALLGDDDGE